MQGLLEGIDVESTVVLLVGLGTFGGAIYGGFVKGLKRVQEKHESTGPVFAGASIMDNMTMMRLTEHLSVCSNQIEHLTDAMRDNSRRIERLIDKL